MVAVAVAVGAGAGAVVVAVEAVEAVTAAGSVLGGSLAMVLLCVEGGEFGGVSISTGDGRGETCPSSETTPLPHLTSSLCSAYNPSLYPARISRPQTKTWYFPASQTASAANGSSPTKASESRLYSFTPETREKLRKFRLGTSRASTPQAVICTHPIPSHPLHQNGMAN